MELNIREYIGPFIVKSNNLMEKNIFSLVDALKLASSWLSFRKTSYIKIIDNNTYTTVIKITK